MLGGSDPLRRSSARLVIYVARQRRPTQELRDGVESPFTKRRSLHAEPRRLTAWRSPRSRAQRVLIACLPISDSWAFESFLARAKPPSRAN